MAKLIFFLSLCGFIEHYRRKKEQFYESNIDYLY